MFTPSKFDVEVRRTLNSKGLRWPTHFEAADENNLGCNRSYLDLRGFSWMDAGDVYDREAQLIVRLEAAVDIEEEYVAVEDELYESDEGLFGLDVGVASTVIALSAAGCVPCSSCNAGAYGGHHHEQYPVVAFCAQNKHVALILECATRAQVGIDRDESGFVAVYSDDIRKMPSFAKALIERCNEFDALDHSSKPLNR